MGILNSITKLYVKSYFYYSFQSTYSPPAVPLLSPLFKNITQLNVFNLLSIDLVNVIDKSVPSLNKIREISKC